MVIDNGALHSSKYNLGNPYTRLITLERQCFHIFATVSLKILVIFEGFSVLKQLPSQVFVFYEVRAISPFHRIRQVVVSYI